jgi:hypothetical protein
MISKKRTYHRSSVRIWGFIYNNNSQIRSNKI